jgi:hypothetical protein
VTVCSLLFGWKVREVALLHTPRAITGGRLCVGLLRRAGALHQRMLSLRTRRSRDGLQQCLRQAQCNRRVRRLWGLALSLLSKLWC